MTQEQIKLIIQQNLINAQSLQKIEKCTKDIPREFVSIIPFSDEIISNNELEGIEYIPIGSCRLVELAYSLHWKGLHFNDDFNYESASKNRDDMLNSSKKFNNIYIISDAIEFLRKHKNKDFFIRPSNDLKYFSGQVMKAKEAADFLEDALLCESSGTYKLSEHTNILISEPLKIQMEWRYFVIDRKIVSGSVYRRHGQLIPSRENDAEVLREAQTFADKWLPDDCVVMDLALVDGKLFVIEFNCINGSGYYDHDIRSILKGLYEYHL